MNTAPPTVFGASHGLGPTGEVKAVCWTSDDFRLVSCGQDGAAYEYDILKEGRRVSEARPGTGTARAGGSEGGVVGSPGSGDEGFRKASSKAFERPREVIGKEHAFCVACWSEDCIKLDQGCEARPLGQTGRDEVPT